MSALAFLVRGRSVDLVAMTAFNTLRDTLGLGDEVLLLNRDDVFVIEGIDGDDAPAWVEACKSHQHWFNPNKHRFAACLAGDGALEAARSGTAWPDPWLERRVDTDRPDLVAAATDTGDPLAAWLGLGRHEGAFAVPLIAWDREDGVGSLPGTRWPDPERTRLRGVLWTLVLRAASAEAARDRADAIAVTRARRNGLLVHPHMQGHSTVGPARPLAPAAT